MSAHVYADFGKKSAVVHKQILRTYGRSTNMERKIIATGLIRILRRRVNKVNLCAKMNTYFL